MAHRLIQGHSTKPTGNGARRTRKAKTQAGADRTSGKANREKLTRKVAVWSFPRLRRLTRVIEGLSQR